jgi:hypothetical protein
MGESRQERAALEAFLGLVGPNVPSQARRRPLGMAEYSKNRVKNAGEVLRRLESATQAKWSLETVCA